MIIIFKKLPIKIAAKIKFKTSNETSRIVRKNEKLINKVENIKHF